MYYFFKKVHGALDILWPMDFVRRPYMAVTLLRPSDS